MISDDHWIFEGDLDIDDLDVDDLLDDEEGPDQ